MAATGNAVANGYWEAKLSSNQKPHYESSDLEPFIRRKYCNKEFAEGTWPPALPDEAIPSDTSSQSPPAVARQAQKAPARPGTAGGSQPQLASDASAGRQEAGGFWGSLSPQESSVAADLLFDAPPGVHLTTVTPGQQRHSQQLNANSPALLIDLMDFGAESTFQLPTTPRRQTTPLGSVFGAVDGANRGAPNMASTGASSGSRSGVDCSTSQGAVPSSRVSNAEGSGSPAADTALGLGKQQSSFPLLRPPPQVLQYVMWM